VLVGRRNDRTPPWTFPAGEQDVVNGEDPADTARREVKEETGLRIMVGDVIGERVHPKTGRQMVYIAAEPASGSIKVIVGDEEELAEVKWASYEEALSLMPDMFGPVKRHLARVLAGERQS
jgi:NADH pyrophosphatase NudC (nudix superfamily)